MFHRTFRVFIAAHQIGLIQLRKIMAPTQCCPKCPLAHELSTSGLYHHRGACREYKKYMAARWTLRHQLELEATDAAPAVKRPRTLRSPQGPQRERGAMQFPVTGPAGGDVMVYGRRRVRA